MKSLLLFLFFIFYVLNVQNTSAQTIVLDTVSICGDSISASIQYPIERICHNSDFILSFYTTYYNLIIQTSFQTETNCTLGDTNYCELIIPDSIVTIQGWHDLYIIINNISGCTDTLVFDSVFYFITDTAILLSIDPTRSYYLDDMASDSLSFIPNIIGGIYEGEFLQNHDSLNQSTIGIVNVDSLSVDSFWAQTYTYTYSIIPDSNCYIAATSDITIVRGWDLFDLDYSYCNSDTTLFFPLLDSINVIEDTYYLSYSGSGIINDTLFPFLLPIGDNILSMEILCPDGSVLIDTITITVINNPNYNIQQYFTYHNADTILLVSSDTLSYFTINSIQNSSFIPENLPLGWNIICENYNTIGCINSCDSIYIAPTLMELGIDTHYCINESTYTFPPHITHIYGLGVSVNTSFNPSMAAIGSFYLYQIYADTIEANVYIDSLLITVYNMPIASFSTQDTLVCNNAESINLMITSSSAAGGTFTGSGIVGNLFDPTIVPCDTSYQITYQVSENSCINSDTLIIDIACAPLVNFSLSDFSMCQNADPVLITYTPDDAIITVSTLINDSLYPSLLSPGIYSYYLSYTDSMGCSNFDTIIITILPLPVAEITSASNTVCNGDPLTLYTNSIGSDIISWSNQYGEFLSSSSSLIIYPEHTQLYNVNISNTEGCTNKDTFSINVLECFTEIPPIFTPNGDGENDEWIIQGVQLMENKLTIYDRWGQPLISYYNYQNNWDGTIYGEPLPEGVYYYQLELGNTPTQIFTGSITLIR